MNKTCFKSFSITKQVSGIGTKFIIPKRASFNKVKTFVILFFCALFYLCTIEAGLCEPNLNQINAQRDAAQKRIHKLRLLEKIETNKLYSNQQRLERTEQNLTQSKERYVYTQKEVTDLESQLERVLEEYKELKNSTNKRIVQIYKTKRKNYIEFLLSSKDINNFLDRLYYENIIMRNDKKKIKETQAKTRNIIELKSKIEEQKRYLAQNIKSMDREQKNITAAISENEKLIERLKTDRATWERAERELARQSSQLTTLINKSVNSGGPAIAAVGGFVRPVYGGITSYYGWRVHPIFNKRIFHSGVDIGAPMGTKVKAANSGRVIFVGWYGGYGKVIIIDHGRINGTSVTTLYAHLSNYSVSQGEDVTKGQNIGNVGTTGYSTGPHLHFEVRVNGSTTNPLNYIPG